MPIINYFPSGGSLKLTYGQCIGSYQNSNGTIAMPSSLVKTSYLSQTPPYFTLTYSTSSNTTLNFTILKKAQLRLKKFATLYDATANATILDPIIFKPGYLYSIVIAKILSNAGACGRTNSNFTITEYSDGILTNGTVIFQNTYISGEDATSTDPLFKIEFI